MKRLRTSKAGLFLAAAFATMAIESQAQQYNNVGGTNVPNLGSATEAAKFGDWDLDGDLDLVYANGGDPGNQQSRLLINQGGAQGGTVGMYLDKTSTQLLPNFVMSSRDVQPVDIDNDGDLDFYFSNHSMNGNQSNVWFVNQGGQQGGSAGNFQLDMSRWVGIGAAGSSIPGPLKVTTGNMTGGFVDWSCQCDFADVDFDGDEDLFHSSYGQSFSGTVMSRLFLNDGGGFFAEYNPSTAISGNPNLNDGSRAGYAEGAQQQNTTNTSGQFHDITNVALDADFADFDGDFDIDVQVDSRNTQQRIYQNRWFENNQTLGSEVNGTRLYRDMTGQWLLGPNGKAEQPGANYDNDFHDMDNDSDVDGYFLGYIGTTDNWAVNDGVGNFTGFSTVPNSGNDDNEIDWHDYDHDGDTDPFVSAFSGTDRFYKNQFMETASINLVQVTGMATGAGSATLGSDMGDMDNDGDIDIISAEDGGVNEVLLRNNKNLPDPIAPRIDQIEQLVSGNPSSKARRVVGRVWDNVNFEYFRTATGTFNYTVNGNPHQSPAKYIGGNIWRATLPGYFYGNISYSMSVTDRVGNTGTSATKNVSIPLQGFTTFGSDSAGCHGAHTLGVGTAPTVANPEFTMTCTGGPASSLALCLVTDSQGTGLDEFGVGLAIWADVLGATNVYGLDAPTDGAGLATAASGIPNNPALAGGNWFFQFIFYEASCNPALTTSGGGQLTILP